jgi:hypothetical protein
MKQKKGKKEAVIICIINNGVVQDQEKEDDNDPQQCCHKGPDQIIQSGPSEDVFIKSGKVVEQDPGKRQTDGTGPKTCTQCNGYINAKHLWLNLNLPEYVKKYPGRRSSQEVEYNVKKALVPVVLHSVADLFLI